MQIVRLQKDINEESQRAVSNLRRPPSYTVYPASPLPVYKPFTGLALATGGRGAEGRGRGRGAEGRGRRGVHYREGECMGTADNLPIRARRGTGKAGNPGRTARHVPGPLLSHLTPPAPPLPSPGPPPPIIPCLWRRQTRRTEINNEIDWPARARRHGRPRARPFACAFPPARSLHVAHKALMHENRFAFHTFMLLRMRLYTHVFLCIRDFNAGRL